MNTNHFLQNAKYAAFWFLAATAGLGVAQTTPIDSTGTAMVDGYVRDSTGGPVANASVSLAVQDSGQAVRGLNQITHSDSQGRYRFLALRAGLYSLRAEMPGYDAIVTRVNLAQHETTKVDLVLGSNKTSKLLSAIPPTPAPAQPITKAPEFFDEPQFTVAGVTPAASAGGHGSDTILRTTEALAKATVSLSNDVGATSSSAKTQVTEDALRKTLAQESANLDANRQLGRLLIDNGRLDEAIPYLRTASLQIPADADLHHLLGKAEEAAGSPLEAVREYQRAAEIDPRETNLFDWGTELLAHRAFEPATEIFTRGNHLYPDSVRMLIALGVSWYARGDNNQGAHYLVNASDLAPANPEPYEFLGKMQSVEISSSPSVIERLARFAQLRPDNALANYYYAAALAKQLPESSNSDLDRSSQVESLLQKAVHLEPKLGAAYLQLGILYSQRADFTHAVSAYKNAIEVSSDDEVLQAAHYRLGQVYQRIGEKTEAQQELQLHDRIADKTKNETERARRQIQEFVISLQNKPAVSHQP